MITAKVESIDLSGFERIFSKENLARVQLGLAEAVGSDCQVHVPMETGTLRGSMKIEQDAVSWNTDYAEYVYNMRGVNWTTPNTSGDWFEVAKAEHLKDWERSVGDALLSEV